MSGYATFYIDPDDEIPSLVSRMKSTDANFLVFVIPPRALLFSSIVTMRLLKKEADRLEKDIILVTQDESGFDMAKRVGFMTRRSVEELPFSSQIPAPSKESLPHILEEDTPPASYSSPAVTVSPTRRSDAVRSFDAVPAPTRIPVRLPEKEESNNFSDVSQSNQEREVVPSATSHPQLTETKIPQEIAPSRESEQEEIGSSTWNDRPAVKRQPVSQLLAEKQSQPVTPERKVQTDMRRANIPEKVLVSPRNSNSSDDRQGESVGSRAQWVIAVSFFVIFGMAVGIGMYMRSPEVNVVVHPKKGSVSGDVTYMASAEGSEGALIHFFDHKEVMKVTMPATGLASGAGRKAYGTATIFNNFSTDEQPLVATTRLQSPDGKIFRITKSVVIPGMQTKDGGVQAGQVDVEVQADSAGAEYNIEATKFTIPGFTGGPKYEKIYAESKSAMTGGGVGDEKNRSVSAGDIAEAKKKMEADIRKVIAEKAKAELPGGMTLDDLMEIQFSEDTAVPSVGTVTDTFDFQANVSVRYAVFVEQDIKKMAVQKLGGDPAVAFGENSNIHIEYGKMTPDFETKTVDMKMFVSGDSTADIPVDAIRADISGKGKEELQGVLDKYPQVEGFEIEMSRPGFSNALPADPEKIHIEVR